jgi:hydroxymethylpyrimidine/phosphomethylpyrimidine kinase
VTADLAIMAAHGFFGISAITALTVQSTRGVAAVHPVDAAILTATLDHLVADIPPVGIKIGMLANGANARAVCAFLRRVRGTLPHLPVVLDPVLRSSSGRELLDPEGVRLLREELPGLVDWITPNIAELAELAPGSIDRASSTLSQSFPALNIVVTGGDQDANDLVLLADGRSQWMRGHKLASPATHGTGCAFSSALLCNLCNGDDALNAALAAKRYVEEAIRSAPRIGGGNGPMNLLWPLEQKQPLERAALVSFRGAAEASESGTPAKPAG